MRLMQAGLALILAILSSLALPAAPARAAAPMPLTAGMAETPLDPHAEHYADRDGNIELSEARALAEAGRFVPFRLRDVLHDPAGQTHWVRVPVVSRAARPARWILDLNAKKAPVAEVYLLRGGAPERILAIAPDSRFDARPILFRNLAVPVALDPGERAEIFIRLRLHTNIELELTVQDPVHYATAMAAENGRYFLFHGFILCLAVMTLALAAALREPAALFYALYIGSVASWVFLMDGFSFQYFWPGWPGWAGDALRPHHAAMGFFGACFARAFYRLSETHPLLDRLFLGVMAGTAALALSTVVSGHRLLTGAGFLFIVASAQIYLATGIVAVRRGWPGSVPFLVGASAVAVASWLAIMAHAIPEFASIDQTRDWGRVAFAIEAVGFLTAIGARIARIRRERAEADARAISALEAQLALAEELRAADAAHARATALAERRRTEMAHATHDLRQPLASLRLSLRGMRALPGSERAQLERQCAYLEDLVTRYLDEATGEAAAAGEEGGDEDGGGDGDGRAAPAPGAGAEGPRADGQRGDDPPPRSDPEAAPLPGTREDFPIRLLLDTVRAMFAEEARARGIALRVVPSGAMVSADPMVAIRIVSNLVSNAVRHSGEGRVLIGCRRAGDGAVTVAVCDTGPGMSAARLAAMRAPGARGAGSEGKGLGLALIAGLAADHGLALRAESVPGRGSCFAVTLPRAAAGAGSATGTGTATGAGTTAGDGAGAGNGDGDARATTGAGPG